MKATLVILGLLLATSVYCQQTFDPQRGRLLQTYTNYGASSDDTSGTITVPVTFPLNAREVGVIAIASDSVHATLTFNGTNSLLTTLTTDVYADSLAGWGDVAYSAAAPYTKVIMLKGPGINRLEGCTNFTIGTLFLNAAQQGTTSGRTLKFYLWWLP